MDRARLVVVMAAVSFVVSAAELTAQTTPAEGWVVLPVEEYRALRERAIPPPPPPTPPPMDATVTRVDYDLRVDADAVTGRVALTIDVLRDGWTKVQIPAGLMAREATLDGRPVSLVDGPPPHVLLSRPGRSVLTLDIVMPLASAAGTDSINIPPSASPISRVRFALPRSGIDLSVSGGFLADHAEAATESRWTVFGRPNQSLRMTWKRKVDDRRADQPLRMRARIVEVVGFGEDACQLAASVRVEVVQGLAREIVVALPAGLAVNQVDGATVADWSVADNALRLRLLEPTAAEASFVIQADARTAREGAIAVPLVRMPAAERETGGVAIDVVGAGEIANRQLRGFEPADPTDLGELPARRESPSLVAFRSRPLEGAEPRSLTVSIVRYAPQAVFIANVEEARYRMLASEDGRLLVEARYAVRNNQRSFLKATLPAGSTVWSADVGGRPVRPAAAEQNAILLPLEKGRGGEEAPAFVVMLVYMQRIDPWRDKARARVELPALDLPVSRTGIELHYSPRYRLEPQPGAFRVDSDPGPLSAALIAAPPPPPPSALPAGAPPPPPPAASPSLRLDQSAAGLQALVDRFRNESGGRTAVGSLPVHVGFPAFGPSIFLASELTAESGVPAVDLLVKRTGH